MPVRTAVNTMAKSVFPNRFSTKRQAIVNKAEAFALQSIPYVEGGTSKTGIDCSGLALKAYQQAGVVLPHSAALQAKLFNDDPGARLVSYTANVKNMNPGDLLFYYGSLAHPELTTHVAVFLRFVNGLPEIAQATDETRRTEIILATRYVKPYGIGQVLF